MRRKKKKILLLLRIRDQFTHAKHFQADAKKCKKMQKNAKLL
jgi:hypothetical protein